MNRRIRVAAVAVAVASTAACGGQSGTPMSPGADGGAGTTISTASTPLGTVLTGAEGFTLYMLSTDTPTTSACNADSGCSRLWRPALAPARVSDATLPGRLGTLVRTDGSTQITYQGHPLYTYAKDSGPHRTNSENVLHAWHVVTPQVSAP